jgi:hypothetical protein
MTEYGAGDSSYLGEYCWVDDSDEGVVGEMDEHDIYMLCPRLGPGLIVP